MRKGMGEGKGQSRREGREGRGKRPWPKASSAPDALSVHLRGDRGLRHHQEGLLPGGSAIILQ